MLSSHNSLTISNKAAATHCAPCCMRKGPYNTAGADTQKGGCFQPFFGPTHLFIFISYQNKDLHSVHYVPSLSLPFIGLVLVLAVLLAADIG